MNKKTDVEVIINDKRYTLSGYESGEYIQKVAAYLNSKYAELKAQDFYKTLDLEMKNVLLQINLADDYFKLKEQVKSSESENENKSGEIFDLKHEVIMLQTKLEAVKKELSAAKEHALEEEKNVIRLEAELKQTRKYK